MVVKFFKALRSIIMKILQNEKVQEALWSVLLAIIEDLRNSKTKTSK